MDKPIEYEQTDPRWRDIPYSGTGNPKETIGTDGCGPTCAAMVVATLREKPVTPDKAAWYFKQNGGLSPHDGTYWFIFGRYFAYWKIPCVETNDKNMAKEALKKGWMVISAMRSGRWTLCGHFILAYGLEGNNVKIHDPNSEASYREYADINTYLDQAVEFWIIKEDWRVEIKDVELKSLDTGNLVKVSAVNVDGNNYIKLRDMEKFLPVEIGWDGKNPTFNLKYK